MQYVVSIADMKMSRNKKDIIVTHALGSCIGLTIYDPRNHIGGMLHFMLPGSNNGRIDNPLMFAESGVPVFLNKFEFIGGNIKGSVTKAAGGALINDAKEKSFFAQNILVSN